MKPGYKTTEFFGTVAAATAAWVDALAGSLQDRYAVIATAISFGLYGVSRGLAKLSPAKPPA